MQSLFLENPMVQTRIPSHEADILGRLMVGAGKMSLTRSAAESILKLNLSEFDKDRMHVLAAKARAGELSADEKVEVEAYSRVTSLLGILKSKARRTMKHREGNGIT
jgi:hypothetical protein